jgi:ribonuclease BN (tRNA processing enzyme)
MPAGKTSTTPATVLCLGTGDGWPNGERNHSSYLYEISGTCLLIDCGESVCRTLTSRKFDWNRIDAILISHTHSDHFAGLFMLLQGLWLGGRSRDLTIHLPGHVIKPFKELLKHVYLFDELFGFDLRFVPLKNSSQIRVRNLRITPVLNTHLDGLKKSFQRNYKLPFESFSFAINGGGKRVVHSADIGSPEDLKPLLTKPVDLLMCELAHFVPADLFTELAGRPISQAAFIHVSRANRKRLAAIRKLARKELPGVKTGFPNDGERLRF